MKADIKERWVKALRSGEYDQAREVLHVPETNAYCCLGVLCDIIKDEVGGEWTPDGSFVGPGFGDADDLPDGLVSYVGLDEDIPWEKGSPFINKVINDYSRSLSYTVVNTVNNFFPILNDDGVPFSEIADFIEEYL